MSFDWTSWIAEQRECVPPAPCGRGAGAHGEDLPCDCECITDVVRAAYRRGVEDARAQALAAIVAVQRLGFEDGSDLAVAADAILDLPRPAALGDTGTPEPNQKGRR